MKNYAFIDAQNVYLGIKSLGWKMSWPRFRQYLLDKYKVERVFLFIGYIPKFSRLYGDFRRDGYELIFKPIRYSARGVIKGNCDADLIVHVFSTINEYDRAIIVTSDGDFYSLIRYLLQVNKLEVVLSPYPQDKCASLLKKEARGQCVFMSTLRTKIELPAVGTKGVLYK